MLVLVMTSTEGNEEKSRSKTQQSMWKNHKKSSACSHKQTPLHLALGPQDTLITKTSVMFFADLKA